MGAIFGFIIIGVLLLIVGFVVGWINDNDNGDIFHCLLTSVGVAFIAVALFKVYLLTKGIKI